ncbi:helix-turn-helix domain-containing protein [Kribbella sp. NPDC058245]|uniref:helix-turn-helix domain-containing protein n=1 Tax=Kribbella sp. NPDC058245 TaxID=3346399 RepID=UPI0036EAA367
MTTDAIETLAELGQRIREARLAAALSQAELAVQIGLERSALVKVETGDRKVSALELLRISDALGLPLSHFVHRSPPAMVSRRESLSDDAEAVQRTKYRIDALLEGHLRDAEQLRSLQELADIGSVPRATVRDADSARAYARTVRAFAEIPIGPLPPLADVAERVGLYILVADFDVDGSSLSPAPGFGVAVLGGHAPSGRRRFTAAHEIGHHVLGDEYQSDVGVAASRDEREKLIDVFAGELLLPSDELLAEWSRHPGEDSWTRLVRLAATYRISWTAVVRAACQRKLIAKAETQALYARTPQRGDFMAIYGDVPLEDLSVGAVGPRWKKAVLAAYRSSRITKARAVELLHGALTEEELPTVDEPRP